MRIARTGNAAHFRKFTQTHRFEQSACRPAAIFLSPCGHRVQTNVLAPNVTYISKPATTHGRRLQQSRSGRSPQNSTTFRRQLLRPPTSILSTSRLLFKFRRQFRRRLVSASRDRSSLRGPATLYVWDSEDQNGPRKFVTVKGGRLDKKKKTN